jgi:formamidopyrimidine-DNA glycosylase
MPELPDLEVFAKNLKSKVLHKRITAVHAVRPKRVRNRPSSEYPKGRRIESVERDGKMIRFRLDDDREFVAHLMLNGSFAVIDAKEIDEVKHKTLELHLGDVAFVLADSQGLAFADFDPPADPAPDALSEEFTPEYWLTVCRKKPKVAVKTLLVNQDVVKGIGNAYSDEILYVAKVAPQSLAGSIPEDKLLVVHETVGEVLCWAMKQRMHATPHALGGEERSFLRVHRSDLEKTSSGKKIKTIEVAGKKSYYTDEQIVYGSPKPRA